MRQILQNLGTGETILAEVPVPAVSRGALLVKTGHSLVSLGTEKMLVDFGKANILDKARKQPDKVKQVLQKVKTDGLNATIKAVQSKLDQPIALGYSNVGKVIDFVSEAGAIDHSYQYKIGDRVVSNGPHAEVVSVNENLCAKIPDNVSDEEATFTVVGAIGLQGVRLAKPSLGERFVVTGLGIIGLLCVQMLRANGCEVLGIDIDSEKCEIARKFGASIVDLSKTDNPLQAAEIFTRGQGVDGVLITASTKSNEVVHQAAEMCRKRGRIILVGVVGLELQRSDFYEKELSFQVSCSYGPGRYENNYEEKGLDYPIGFVRWTEQRNFEAVLTMLSNGSLNVMPLISHRFDLDCAIEAYDIVSSGKAMGIVLGYPNSEFDISNLEDRRFKRTIKLNRDDSKLSNSQKSDGVVVGMLGAGNFSGQVLLPALKKTNVRFKTIVSGTGVSGTHQGKKNGFEQSSTDGNSIYEDSEINAVFITTRHGSHAKQVLGSLKSKKAVFVEKPLCLTLDDLSKIEKQLNSESGWLMVGYNRRFSPHSLKIKQLLSGINSPISMIFTANVGAIPKNHWTQDLESGGGRLIGEACHFIDLCRYFADYPIIDASVSGLGGQVGTLGDIFSIHLKFENGSIATIHYFANGHKSFPKERLEIFAEGKIIQLDNFRKLSAYGWKGFKSFKTKGQAKGHREEMELVVESIRNGHEPPIPIEESIEVTRVSIELAKDLYHNP